MFTSILFWYFIVLTCIAISFYNATDFKKFFFYSEIIWLSIFILMLGINLILNNSLIFVNTFFILVFTACEAVTLAAILLLSSESSMSDLFKKNI